MDYALYAHPESLTGVWRPLGLTEGLTADDRVAAAAEQSLSALGIPFELRTPRMPFSTDFGNVSRRVPSAMIGFAGPGPESWAVHLDEGEEQFTSGEGETLALTMSRALAVAADRLTRFATAQGLELCLRIRWRDGPSSTPWSWTRRAASPGVLSASPPGSSPSSTWRSPARTCSTRTDCG